MGAGRRASGWRVTHSGGHLSTKFGYLSTEMGVSEGRCGEDGGAGVMRRARAVDGGRYGRNRRVAGLSTRDVENGAMVWMRWRVEVGAE
jgi:hypothetical protein